MEEREQYSSLYYIAMIFLPKCVQISFSWQVRMSIFLYLT